MPYTRHPSYRSGRGELRRLTKALNKPETKSEPVRGLQWWVDKLGTLRTLVGTIVILAVTLILVVSIVMEWRRGSVVLEPFSVPPDMEKDGYTSQVIANELADKVRHIKKVAKSRAPSLQFVSTIHETVPDIEVPTASVSLKSIIQYVEGLLGYSPTRISGELIMLAGKPRLTIRIVKNDGKYAITNLTPPGDKPDLDSLLNQGAQFIMKDIEPYILASYMYEAGEKEAALELVQHCIYRHPPNDDVWAYILWGLILNERKDYQGAIAKYKAALKPELGASDHIRSVIYLNWGLASKNLERYDEAIDKYRKAIAFNPSSALAFSHWGSVLQILQLKRNDMFDAYLKSGKPEAVNPEIALNWFRRDDRKSGFEQAVKKYQAAIDLDPELARTYENWGMALWYLKKHEEAADKFQAATIINPRSESAYRLWGDLLVELQNYKGAIPLFKKMIEINSRSVTGYQKCAAALRENKEYDESIAFYKKAVELSPEDKESYKWLGNLLSDQKSDYDGALVMYEKAVALNTKAEDKDKDLDIYLCYGKFLHEAKALELYKKVVELDLEGKKRDVTEKSIRQLEKLLAAR